MFGFGWCHLRSSRQPLRSATLDSVRQIDDEIDRCDELLWLKFREWMTDNSSPFLQWQLHEQLNNETGMLHFCVSRNHRASTVWAMLDWIAQNGVGSYGLFYCNDDEDVMDRNAYNRNPPMDYTNQFRVHRILNGSVTELDDPFFGLIDGGIDPVHPYNKS